MAARAGWPIVAAGLLAAAVSAAVPPPGADGHVVVRNEHGEVLARIGLGDGGRVTLRYRNSLYGSVAEERFVAEGPALRLVELAADERAVLDEYYEIAGGARPAGPGDDRAWSGVPQRDLVIERLVIAATDLGERTLIVPGRPPVDLYGLVEDTAPTVVVTLERPG
jgi:hypothetical protein